MVRHSFARFAALLPAVSAYSRDVLDALSFAITRHAELDAAVPTLEAPTVLEIDFRERQFVPVGEVGALGGSVLEFGGQNVRCSLFPWSEVVDAQRQRDLWLQVQRGYAAGLLHEKLTLDLMFLGAVELEFGERLVMGRDVEAAYEFETGGPVARADALFVQSYSRDHGGAKERVQVLFACGSRAAAEVIYRGGAGAAIRLASTLYCERLKLEALLERAAGVELRASYDGAFVKVRFDSGVQAEVFDKPKNKAYRLKSKAAADSPGLSLAEIPLALLSQHRGYGMFFREVGARAVSVDLVSDAASGSGTVRLYLACNGKYGLDAAASVAAIRRSADAIEMLLDFPAACAVDELNPARQEIVKLGRCMPVQIAPDSLETNLREQKAVFPTLEEAYAHNLLPRAEPELDSAAPRHVAISIA